VKRLPAAAKCPRCGTVVVEAGGLFRCLIHGGFGQWVEVSSHPLTPREQFELTDGVNPLGPRGGRPTPLDRRIK
jgi:hypothetical protein